MRQPLTLTVQQNWCLAAIDTTENPNYGIFLFLIKKLQKLS
jgi:hypothetical protein